METFRKAFTPPFKHSAIGRVNDSKGNFCFQFVNIMLEDEFYEFAVAVINNEKEPKYPDVKYSHDEGYIKANDKDILLIRGWGYLIGTGGLNLKEHEAANIQDSLADYIVARLNRNN